MTKQDDKTEQREGATPEVQVLEARVAALETAFDALQMQVAELTSKQP